MTVGIPFKKGKSGNPAGRPVGSLNKVKFEVGQILKQFNCDPFEILARIATNNLIEEDGSKTKVGVRMRMESAAELASYVAPKLKSIELKGDQQAPVIFEMKFGDVPTKNNVPSN